MENIDWDKAPEWADRVVRIGIAQNIAWACDRKYKYISGDGPFCFFNDPSDGFMLCQTTLVESRPSPSPAWSGEGLPPVDVECEYQCNDVTYRQAWVAVTPRYIGESITVLKHSASGSEFTEMTASCVFRPIRTPEQIAADEREAAIKSMAELIGQEARCAGSPLKPGTCLCIARTLVIDGYRKP